MTGLSTYTANAVANWSAGKAAMPALPTPYLALFTTQPADDGTGGVEVSGGGYARAAIANTVFGSPSGVSPVTITTANAISFATSTGTWGTVVGWALMDASTAGHILESDYLGNYAWQPFTASANATASVLTVPAHGYVATDTLVVTGEYGGTLPAGMTAGTATVGASPTTDSFTTGVATTTSGGGTVRKVSSQVVPNNTTVTFASGALTLTFA